MKRSIIIIICFLAPYYSISQDREATTFAEFPRCDLKLNGQYFTDYWHDFKYIAIAPVRWEKKDWLTLAAIVGAGAILYSFDQDIHEWVQGIRTGTADQISHYAEWFGNGRYPPIGSAALYLYGSVLKKDKPKRLALLILETYAISGLYTRIAKFAFGRWRPSDFPAGEPQYNYWEGPTFKVRREAFFSGHTNTAFALATVFALEFEDTPWVGMVSYSMAALCGLSRIYDGAHWPTDVLVGAASGFFISSTIIRRHTCEESPKALIYPHYSNGSTGIGFTYKF